MPTSTPEQKQKSCAYCGTPANPLAVSCQSCGSALPIALPKSVPEPVARLVEAQSKWSMGKTALVSIVISLLAGLFLDSDASYTVGAGILATLWLALVLPVMLVTSAIMTARRNPGHMLLGLLASIGLWGLGVILVTAMALAF